jgi:hypothetical protein
VVWVRALLFRRDPRGTENSDMVVTLGSPKSPSDLLSFLDGHSLSFDSWIISSWDSKNELLWGL